MTLNPPRIGRAPEVPGLVARSVVLLTAGALLATGCTDGGANADPTGAPTTPAPTVTDTATPDALDADTATSLVVARFDAIYGLPPTSPDDVDVDAVGDGILAPGSPEAERVTATLTRAIERGIVERGDVQAEVLDGPSLSAGGSATALLCISQSIRTTDLETGEDTGAPAPPEDWRTVTADYQRVEGQWLVADLAAVEPGGCVPPSIEDSVRSVWTEYVDAWVDYVRAGSGPDIGPLADLVTEDFAEALQGFPSHEPVDDPERFTDFELTEATRTTATGRACLAERLQAVEWLLVDGQWQIDFVGRDEEPTPCA